MNPKSVYIYGSVGVGKTFAADLWLSNAQRAAADDKSESRRLVLQRWHFHSFMLHVHQQLHNLRVSKTVPPGDQLRHLAKSISDSTSLVSPCPCLPRWLHTAVLSTATTHLFALYLQLFFDEFQVSDVGDAMIMQRLFSLLLDSGVVLVATSNRAPEGLYENGLNRELFLPFIDMLRLRCDVLDVDALADGQDQTPEIQESAAAADASGHLTRSKSAIHTSAAPPITHERDFRLQLTALPEACLVAPCDSMPARTFVERVAGKSADAPFESFTCCSLAAGFGRSVAVRRAHRVAAKPSGGSASLQQGTAVMSFHELCGAPVGASDYYAVADAFHTLFLVGIPRLTLNDANMARRFITLIDVLYEAKVRTVFVSDVPLDRVLDGIRLDSTARVPAAGGVASQLGVLDPSGAVAVATADLRTTSGGGVAPGGSGAHQYSDSQLVSLNVRSAGGDEGDAFIFKRGLDESAGVVHFEQALSTDPSQRYGGCDTSLGAPGSAATTVTSPASTRVASHGGSSSAWGTTMVGDVEWSATGRIGVSLAELSGVTDVAFAMHRALSRLTEMQSQQYMRSSAQAHGTGAGHDAFIAAPREQHAAASAAMKTI